MKTIHFLALAGGLLYAASSMAQPLASGLVTEQDRLVKVIDGVPVNMAKYPDYRSGNFNPEPVAEAFISRYNAAKAQGRSGAAATGRPDHVNNAATRYFPPVFNQSSGSCGAASRIAYMFSHEQNAYRDTDGSLPENYYPTHFVFLLTYGNSGKDEFVLNVGIPSAKTYGGQTYSNLFGYNEWDDEDYGWMTGYEKWYEAFHNKCEKITSVPASVNTEEGSEFAKNWLWNHCGDTSFHAGGLIGLGVASGGKWLTIPKTDANDEAGVTGMYYVKQWGTSVDHALTMVGYDDRIEFDLDGDGIYGEAGSSRQINEKGAWIIVNSWGNWCNGGFIYCPYAYAGPTSNADGTFPNNFWYGELYHVRKDYRPFRTIKLKMDYSHRSELLLQAGVSTDLSASEPENVISMDHFKYAGDGHSGNTDPAPAVPMLGKWADGKMHHEPMEFGYDLTDLSSGYDRNQPLKYFFIVNRKKATSLGSGHIYEASIIDYERDIDGIETPFDLGETGEYEITTKGNKLIISCIVYGAGYNAPNNLSYADGRLLWTAPDLSSHTVASYNIYKEGALVDNVTDMSWDISRAFDDLNGDGQIDASDAPDHSESYAVAAVYTDGQESAKKTICTTVSVPEKNQTAVFSKQGFSIPDVFDGAYDQATIEFWFRPTTLSSWNNTAGPGWGTWYQHVDASGHYYCGWNTSDRIVSNKTMATATWYYVSIVVNKNRVSLYINGQEDNSITSYTYSGIGGFGDYVFSAADGKAQQARYDEIRIWNYARSASQIKEAYASSGGTQYYGDVLPEGLLAYYKGDCFQGEDGSWYLRDCAGGHHAKATSPKNPQTGSATPAFTDPAGEATISINDPGIVYAGLPFTLTATRSDAINHVEWTAPVATSALAPTVVFDKVGEYEVAVSGTDYAGNTVKATRTVKVLEAPAIDASFTASKASVAAGERISFKPAKVVNGYAYSWSMPGAQAEEVHTVSAGAAYEQFGTYTVTLTVTDASGNSASTSQQITVEEVAPVAAFSLTNSVIMKGQKVALVDESKYAPSKWQWQLSGSAGNVVINGQNTLFEATTPGVFDVSLMAANEAGRSTATRERALVVVNADSKNGLSFSQNGARVTPGTIPFDAAQRAYTIEWWMKPSKITSYCLGLGATDATFQIKTGAGGKMVLTNKSRSATSADGYVIEGQWHHYAVMVNGTTVTFYRDGLKVSTGSTATGIAEMPSFSIGTSAADWNGSIDEFRIWNRALTLAELDAVCNEPLPADVSTLASTLSNADLRLYYDFNQSGGAVKDRGQHMNDGVRSGFGPDGDAWDLSKGVFCLNFDVKATEDVTAKYLTNYKRSFARETTTVNNSTASRFFKIKDWTLENTTVAGDVTTGVHVDKSKSYDFTCTTGWDGFGNLTNHKAFQVVDLEPGLYTLEVTFGQHGAAGQTYLVAAAGETLPNAADLEESALSYCNLADGHFSFIVPEQQKVALGVLVGGMSGQSIFTIQKFTLTRGDLDIREAQSIEGIEDILLAPDYSNDAIYDLSGRRVTNAQNGLFIQNGKKVIR